MKPTPETDAVAETRIIMGRPREIVDAGFARTLERERDTAESRILHYMNRSFMQGLLAGFCFAGACLCTYLLLP